MGTVVFMLLPSVLKVSHAYQYHAVQNDCKHSTTHLHSSKSHNEVLDYYFQVLAESDSNKYDFQKPFFNTEKVENYKSLTYNTVSLKLASRGPPFLDFNITTNKG